MVGSVSAFSVIHTLIKGTDRAKKDAGIYKDLDGDYERLPLLILGCFGLLAGKLQKATHTWERTINFWEIGDNISSLCDYWDIVDFTQYCSRTLSFTARAATGMNIHKWKAAGSFIGGLAYSHTLYSDWIKDTSKVGLEVEEANRATYRAYHQNQKFCDLTIIACILVAKIIGFCSAVHALSGASKIMQLIVAYKEDLLLGAYATYTFSAIASIYYEQQMENQKRKACHVR